ncbi:cytochrome c oxidase subunit 3 [uncultured Pseudacidovorax sp.]|uniref:cytochrome c oxidase subunit 3 n=1 Tax=uncultured Pseudacidovorax sp. TaxID=679313 RepID=UPI0025D97C4B|nr:cytochrome c oxidase subunit 3 [uncultured Pseudacidovorax sp.]
MSDVAPSRHPGINLGQTDAPAHREAEETVFGFWIFLMSDLVLFALLFATYAAMLGATNGGPGPRDVLELRSVGAQTALLLVSSLSFGMASLAMKYGAPVRRLQLWLGLTLLLGLAFLGLSLREFAHLAAEGAVPQHSGWLSSFFALVGTHGLHVALGCFWIGVMMVQVRVFGVQRPVKLRLLRLGLFWHMLDVVWIFLFSVVYLGGLA